MDPLLERDEQLAVLESVVAAARDGRGQLVLVAGEAGIGKTSLVRALRGRLDGPARFVVGACEPLSVPVPLAPWREIVGAEPPGQDSLAFALSVLDVLRARSPAVAVLEDAHWADPATVDVLRLLARRVEDAGVVVHRHLPRRRAGREPAAGPAGRGPRDQPGGAAHDAEPAVVRRGAAGWPARPTSTATGCGA